MILSEDQSTLVAQLVAKQDEPLECFKLIHTNAKTIAFGQLFSRRGLITLSDESVELNSEFFETAKANGLIDDTDQLTERGQELSQQTIEESFKLFRVMLSVVS